MCIRAMDGNLCMKKISIKIYGKVQRVWFRESAKAKALELGIKGFARNDADGSVYVEAKGREKALADFIEWCKQGPELAEVDNIDIKEIEGGENVSFEVLRN